MSDALKHECGIALIRLKKTIRILQGKVWNCFLWCKQNVFNDGKAA
jgi:hypothetical protein